MPPALGATADVAPQRVLGVPIKPARHRRSRSPPEAAQLFDVAELAEQLTTAAAQPIQAWMGFLHQ